MSSVANSYQNLGGTLRAKSADETLRFLKPMLKYFGITRIANVTGLDRIGIPVSIAIRPLSKLLATSQGKGITQVFADVSAAMESIENWHAENLPGPQVIGSYQSLASRNKIVHPSYFKMNSLSRTIDDNENTAWVIATELGSGAEFLIPYYYVSLSTTNWVEGNHSQLFSPTSNGLASGNTVNEAILHGLYEIIERDDLFRFRLLSEKKKNSRVVDTKTIQTPHLNHLLKCFETAQIEFEILDLTSEMGVPTYSCDLYDPDSSIRSHYATGSGTHLSPEIALSRAITEAAQSRVALITGSRDDIFPDWYHSHPNQFQGMSFRNPKGERLAFADKNSNWKHLSFEDDLNQVLGQLKKKSRGSVLVYNLTKPEFEIPVVKVINTNMRLGEI